MAEFGCATFPSQADALRKFGHVLVAIDCVVQIDKAAATLQKLIQFRGPFGCPAGIVRVEDDYVRLLELIGFGPTERGADFDAIGETKEFFPTLLPERIVMLAGA